MPTVFRQDGFRFFFFSNENEEPPHIHVEKAEGIAKFWLHPDVELGWSKGFRQKDLRRIAKIVGENQERILEEWMSSSKVKLNPVAKSVRVTPAFLRVTLADGRELAVPLSWFPRLQKASRTQRSKWRLIGGGVGIHWEDIDEDISVPRLLAK